MIGVLPSSLLAAVPLAVVAGFVSFASPCVFPLVPGYMALLGGALGHDGPKARTRAVAGAISFILGFAVIFVSEGALFGQFGQQFRDHQRLVAVLFGIVTVALGLFFTGWVRWDWLQRERRWHRVPSATVLGAFLLGFFFGVGWAPCIGPTLASILGLAASTSGATAVRGSILAFFYCVGLGLPFLFFAVAGQWATATSRWVRRHQRVIGQIGGVVLMVIGVAEITGIWGAFVTWLQVHSPTVNLPL